MNWLISLFINIASSDLPPTPVSVPQYPAQCFTCVIPSPAASAPPASSPTSGK